METERVTGIDVNRLTFYVLRGGVLLSIAVVLIGLALLAVGQPLGSGGLHPVEIPAELVALHPAGFLGVGILLLILTPVARVCLSIVYSAKERDRPYVLITVAVFLILMLGIALGGR